MSGERLYRTLLRLLPRGFREQCEEELIGVYRHRRRHTASRFALWRHLLADLAVTVPREHWRARFGGFAPPPERSASRTLRAIRWDLGRATRSVLRAPGTTLAIVATVAVCVGGSTLVWSLMEATFLRAAPYAAPERLVWIESFSELDGEGGSSNLMDFRDWRAAARSFSSMAVYWDTSITVDAGELPERTPAAIVSAPFFRVLGVEPVLGRGFDPDEETYGRHRVAVLGYALWQRLFGGDPGVLGRSLRVEGEDVRVVGVMPPGFPGSARDEQLWMPVSFPADHWRSSDRRSRWFDGVVARLAPGVTLEQADAEMRTIARRLAAQHPATNDAIGARVRRMVDVEQAETRTALLALAAGVGLLLCLGCANASSLLLARGTLRQRELALCAALGAGRGRLVRQLLLEAVLLAMVGGAAGAWLARALLPLALAQAAERVPGLETAAVDVSTLWFAFGLSLASAALFGTLPAWLAAGRLERPLRDARQGLSAQRLRTLRLLTGFEVALAALLLCGALLLVRTFEKLLRLDPGFDSRGVLAMDVALLPTDYPSSKARSAYYLRLLEELSAIPGVEAVASTPYDQPLGGSEWSIELGVVGEPLPERASDLFVGRYAQISPEFFRVLRVPLLRGRTLLPTDDERAASAAILNESAARGLFGDDDPLGRRVWLWGPDDTEVEIVGVVGDFRVDSLREKPRPAIFVPLLQASHGLPGEQSVLLRTGGDLHAVASAARERARELDHAQPIGEPVSLEQLAVGSLGLERLSATLSTSFAVVAILLAALGLHGVVSYAVAGRRREVGVRLALGATPHKAAVEIVGADIATVAAGLAAGVGGALLAGRWLASRLYDVAPHDPLILATVVAVLVLVALAAATVPFRRAARVDPAESLRAD